MPKSLPIVVAPVIAKQEKPDVKGESITPMIQPPPNLVVFGEGVIKPEATLLDEKWQHLAADLAADTGEPWESAWRRSSCSEGH